ncbi:MAG: lamin tail domain-containing protein, partial [Patescibacteria group bacterium]
PSSPPPQPSSSGIAGHLLISEVLFDAEGSDGGKEFIELFNPTDQVLDISGWSIQHVSSSGSTSKKNFESTDGVAPHGFFLVWLGNDPRADMVWASGSLNNTSATIYLVNGTVAVSGQNPVSVDAFSYNIVDWNGFAAGMSLERKPATNGVCFSASVSGNGCDTDSVSDWEVRLSPEPQNTQSPSE